MDRKNNKQVESLRWSELWKQKREKKKKKKKGGGGRVCLLT